MEPGGGHLDDRDGFCLTFLGFLKYGVIPPYSMAEPAFGLGGSSPPTHMNSMEIRRRKGGEEEKKKERDEEEKGG